MDNFKILTSKLFTEFCNEISVGFLNQFQDLRESELSIDTFSFYTSVSAVFSSKIEGEEIDLDSYVKHKRFKVEFQPDYTRKIDDLYAAYQFAKSNKINKENIESVHALLTQNILAKSHQGKERNGNMYVTTDDGRIEYVAAIPSIVSSEMSKFYSDLNYLLNTKLSIQEIFFYASVLHIVFLKIHPFEDGNGRTSRLIEKWFLAEKLGAKAWLIQSEKYYYLNLKTYYNSIRKLGLEYETLDYSQAIDFIKMLPNSLEVFN
jgi:Fic family protein